MTNPMNLTSTNRLRRQRSKASRQKGFAASAQVGSYLDYDDGWTQNYQLSWGNSTSGPTQIVVGGNYDKADGVLARDRAISAFPGPYQTV